MVTIVSRGAGDAAIAMRMLWLANCSTSLWTLASQFSNGVFVAIPMETGIGS